jgi:hypothetical protein
MRTRLNDAHLPRGTHTRTIWDHLSQSHADSPLWTAVQSGRSSDHEYVKTMHWLMHVEGTVDAIVAPEMRATIIEYEHALEHVTDPHDGPYCPDCQRLARSALDGVNRASCREIVAEA